MATPRLFRMLLRLLPERWRESVARDLLEDAARSGRSGWSKAAWLAAQVAGIAIWLVGRSLSDRWRSRPGWRQTVDGLAHDVRQARRAIARQPWSTAAIVGTLALGMSAGTAAFAVFNHVLFRPVPGVVAPDRLVTVYFQPADRQPTFRNAPREALAAFRTAASLEALGASDETEVPVVSRAGADAEFVRAEFVTDRYLDLLGVRARAGRLLSDADVLERRSVAVISERWWRRAFGGDPSILGAAITINRHPVSIVGVVADYRGWSALRIGTVDIWMPIDTSEGEAAVSGRLLNLVGRLRPDATPEIAEQQVRAVFAPFASSLRVVMSMGPLSMAPAVPVVYPGLVAVGGDRSRADVAGMYPVALAASALLLVLACANTANLLLARTQQRRRDLAVRSAIGASRWRLARALIVEAAAITTIAAAGAVLLAQMFVRLVEGEQVFDVGPALDAVTIDWRVLGFAAALGVVTVVIFGLIPSLVAARSPMVHALSQSGRTTRQGHRMRAALVGVQLALAVTLLAGAGVLSRSLQNLRSVDLGMITDRVVSFGLSPRRLGYSSERADALVGDTIDRLRRSAGVESVAYASPSPLWRGYSPASLKAQPVDAAPAHQASRAAVSADYFRTLQIPLRAGRAFTASDRQRERTKTSVGILSESLARQLFGEVSPVGRQVYQSRSAQGWSLDRTIEIVGVVGDTRSGVDIRAPNRAMLYEPTGPQTGGAAFFVRSPLPTAEVLATVRSTLREIDPALPIVEAGALQDAVDRLVPEDRVLALLVGGVALIATILGVAGVHAVTANTVAERTREFGIRLALGASRRAVSSGVLRGLAGVAASGLVGGLALFAGASRLLESRVFGISPTDPVTLALVSALLLLAALAGTWIPARRATRVDPAVALRAE